MEESGLPHGCETRAFPGLNGKIAFVSERDGNLDSSATGAAAPAPPVCSAEDTRRNAALDSPPYSSSRISALSTSQTIEPRVSG
jgi:hypothetical protein